MKGVIYNIFESFISENFGADVYEKILDQSSLESDPVFISAGTYPDADLFELVANACKMFFSLLLGGSNTSFLFPYFYHSLPTPM